MADYYLHKTAAHIDELLEKVEGIEAGANVNVQVDWNQATTTADDYIKNKPTIPTVDQTYNAQSANAQSGTAVAQALGTIPSVTVDQTYDSTSANAQSGVAIAGVIGNINTVLEEVL
jgi:flagellar biosynthesis/type III secretory pathway M-ring protein FliF/YscJ